MKKYVYLVVVHDDDDFIDYTIEVFSSKSKAIKYAREVFNIPDNISFIRFIYNNNVEFEIDDFKHRYYKKGEEAFSCIRFSHIIKKEVK